jgi:hypothetical protein
MMKTNLAAIDDQAKLLTGQGLKPMTDKRCVPRSDHDAWIVQEATGYPRDAIDQTRFFRRKSRPLLDNLTQVDTLPLVQSHPQTGHFAQSCDSFTLIPLAESVQYLLILLKVASHSCLLILVGLVANRVSGIGLQPSTLFSATK